MGKFLRLNETLKGLIAAATRYFATAVFLLLASFSNACAISTDKVYNNELMACIVGAALCAALQACYEHFFEKRVMRIVLPTLGALMAGLYYILIRRLPAYSIESNVRTGVIIFAIMLSYMLIPSIKSRLSFNGSFMAAFKSIFQSILYSSVLFVGCALIIAAFDTLIFSISSDAYLHTANVVFVLLAPMLFLSLIPLYPSRFALGASADANAFLHDERISRATHCPKFLETLVSYIIIPLSEIFTVILALYIALNVGGEFWHNNLLEPLLVSYIVVIIFVLFLSATLENKMAVWFCKIFPKVLVPIAAFELFASAFMLRDIGVTHQRYYVILFGIFAVCAGVILSLNLVKNSLFAAALLAAFSFISILPSVGAFSVSQRSQYHRVESILLKNNMLQNGSIVRNIDISKADKEIIVSSMDYLYQINGADKTTWLPDESDYYTDFESIFGFSRYYISDKDGRYINVFLPPETPINIEGYSVIARASINAEQSGDELICAIPRAEKSYILSKSSTERFPLIILSDSDNNELIRFDTGEIFSRYGGFADTQQSLTAEQAVFLTENDRARLCVTLQNASIYSPSKEYYADFLLLIDIKQ